MNIIRNNSQEVKQLQEKIFNITPAKYFPLIRRKFIDNQYDIEKLSVYLNSYISNFTKEEKLICDSEQEHSQKFELLQKAYNLITENDNVKNDVFLDLVDSPLRKKFLGKIRKQELKDEKDHEKYLAFEELVKPLKNLVPKILYGYVLNIIKTQFKNDPLVYIATVPLFFEKFTKKNKLICDDSVEGSDKKHTRQLKRKKKGLLLWAAQLLKLMGGKDKFFRSKILCNALTDKYKDDMLKTDEFIAQHRLVKANGQVLKLVKQSEKQKQKIAQVLKISSVLSQIAKDKGFTYSLVTVTLPPCWHSNPSRSDKNSYNGATPKEAQHQLASFWKRIRAQLAKKGFIVGEDFFGLEAIELQGDSTLHLHALIYHSALDTKQIHKAINSVAINHNKSVNGDIDQMIRTNYKWAFDIRLNDGRASGATYAFKYITKTHSSYDSSDKNAIKNTAGRSYYGCRGFAFFGIKNSLTQFNFLVCNYISYKKYFSKEIRTMFESGDYYTYITKYNNYFENIYTEVDKKKVFIGVTFDVAGSKDMKSKLKDSALNRCTTKVFIEKKQYCIFELASNEQQDIEDITALDLSKISNAGASYAYELVQSKQEDYDNLKNEFIALCDKNGVSILENVELGGNKFISKNFKSIQDIKCNVVNPFLKENQSQKQQQQQNQSQNQTSVVSATLKQPCSRKSSSTEHSLEEKPKIFNLIEKKEKIKTKPLKFSLSK
jgi:hypothetical protein